MVFHWLNWLTRKSSPLTARRRATARSRPACRPRLEELESRVLLSGDRFEPDDTLLTAANVGVAPGVHLSNLSITAGDQDWYQVQLLRPDNLTVNLAFTPAAGNLTAQFTDSLGNNLLGSTGTANGATIALTNLSAGTYYVHVSGVTGSTANTYSLAIDPGAGSTTTVYYVNDTSTTNDFYTQAIGSDANSGLDPAHPKATVQSVLDTYTLGPTSLVLIDSGTYTAAATITSTDQGAAYAGSPGVTTLSGGAPFTLTDADSNLFYGLKFSGNSTGIYAHSGASANSRRNTIQNNTFVNDSTGVEIDGGDSDVLQNNTFTGSGSYGIYLPNAVSATVQLNTFSGMQTAVSASVANVGGTSLVVSGNSISGTNYGVSLYGGAGTSTVFNNQISTNLNQGYGINASGTVTVYGNNVSSSYIGVSSSGATVYGNTIHNNNTGLSGTGTLGGTSWSAGQPNDLNNNTTGIVSSGGAAIQFNLIHANAVGIEAAGGDTIHNNLIYRNTAQGILVDNHASTASNVTITNNTVYTPAGDGVRVRNAASNVSLSNNIIWTANGYDLYVATDSQLGFASDYNNLYTTGSGKVVFWQKDFTDLFDWQVEANYDRHSIGFTAPAPTLDNPQFVNLAGDDYHLTSAVSTSIAAGNPASDFSLQPGTNGGRIELGAYGDTAQAAQARSTYVAIDYPNYYTDWEVSVGHTILWHTYNVTGNVKLQVYDATNTNLLATIADVAASTGSYGWSPQASGLTANSANRYVIRITADNNPSATTASREPFSVPTAGGSYYINDASQTGDEYTTAVGNNRNTGKTAGDPKANLLPMLSAYSLGPGNTVDIDTGYYVEVRNVVISGDGIHGDDQGAFFTGPVHPELGHVATLDRANQNNGTTDVNLYSAGSVTLQYLTLTGAQVGLWVQNNSIRFTGNYLTAANNTQDGIRIEPDSAQTVVGHLTAYNNGGDGIDIATPISSLSNSQAYNNQGTGIYLSNSGPVVVQNILAYGNQTGISVYNSSGGSPALVGDSALTNGNIVHDNSAYGISASGNVLLQGNTVYNQTTGTGISVSSAQASQNVVFNNATGIYGYGATVSGNRVYHNSSYGIDASTYGLFQGNTVYSNGVGILAEGSTFSGQVLNNLVYSNTNQGLLVHSGYAGALLANNTVYQPVGDAIHIENSSHNVQLRNNILWVQAGFDLYVAGDSQVGFQSDYNLLQTTGTGQVAFWQGVARSTLIAWQNTAFTDQNSFAGDPLFVNPAGADGNLGYASPTSDGRDDDFHVKSQFGSFHGGSHAPVVSATTGLPVLLSGTWTNDAAQSPTIDRGDPASAFLNEPAPSGGYVNLGADGNTDQASRSPTDVVNVIRPGSGEVWPIGQTFPIGWRSVKSGENALAFDGVQDYLSVNDAPSLRQASLTLEGWFNFAAPVTSGAQTFISKAAGTGSSQSYALWYDNSGLHAAIGNTSGLGSTLTYSWTPTPGTWYHIAFTFQGGNQAEVLYVNGVLQASGTAGLAIGYDSHALLLGTQFSSSALGSWFAGSMDEVRVWGVAQTQAAIQANMNRTLTGNESGLVAYYRLNEGTGGTTADATVNGNVGSLGGGTTANRPAWVPSTAPTNTVNIDLMQVGNNTPVASIATAVANNGQFLWTVPAGLTPGTNYQIRVTRNDAATTGLGAAFTIGAATHSYYVNDATVNASGDWTTAPGNDTNDGRSPATPKASIQSVLQNYTLGPGDVIYVDAGTYNLTTNIVIPATQSGVKIVGYNNATFPTRGAVLNRGNTSSGSYVIQLAGADNVTLDHLSITGGYEGLYAASGVGSTGLTVSNSSLYGNQDSGAYLLTSNDHATFSNDLFANETYGLNVSSAAVVVSGSTASNCSIGFYVSSDGALLDGDTAYGCSIGVSISSGSAALGIVRNSTVHDNTSSGISASGNVLVQNNTAYRQGTGISVSQSQASGNVAFDNGTGIFGYGATVSGNRVYHNSSYGIDASTYGLFQGNTAYSNGVGIYAEGSTFSGQVLNNLVYGNTNQGLLVHSGYAGALLANNTVYQPVGDAIRLENSSHNVTLRNNILWVQAGYDLFIALDSEVGLDSDYNDLYATATGKLGSWEGQAFSSLASWSYQVGQDAHSLAADPAFVNAAGADGILGFSANPDGSAAQVIDNGGSGFAVSGTWTTATGGFNNSYLQSTTATDVATYTFTGLTPGWFQVAATWPATSGDNQSAYTVLDGGLSAGTVMVNQSQAPADFVAAGASWKTLGLYYLAGTTLTVQLARGYSGYSVAADAVRIQRVQGNGGGDDNFLIQGGSPTIDAGDPATYYLAEPAPNGGRVNLGNTGNTPQAAASPSPLVQVLAPNGLDKLQQGQTVTVQWRSDGLTLTRPVALIDAGGPTQGNWLAEAYRTDSGYHTSFTNAVNTSAVSNPAPQAVYQSYAYTSGGVGSELSYQLPLPDGSYTVRLHFVEPSYGSAGQRLFDVKAQGVLVQANYDIFAAAGAQYKATTLSFTVTAAGGAGLLLELVSRNSAGAILSGIEVTAANANGVASPTANLAVSADGGSTWSNVASNLAMDAYGRGTYAWTVPTTATPGNQYELRVTANTAGQPQGLSQPFLVANNGHSYYVNDNSTAGDVYTTAVGNDLNSGKTPDRPMASLAALLAAYQFGPGDTIYVDTGSYQVVRNIVLGPNTSGVRIQGPGTGVAVLNRGNTSSGSYVVQLAGADNVTLDHLSLTGGYEGLYAASGVGSTGLTVSNSSLYGNQDSGAYLLTSNDHATFSNDLFANETYGLNVSSAAVVVSGSTASNCSIGFYVSSDGALLDGDTAYGCSIGVSISSGSAALGIVRNSTVHDNTSSGISASGNVLVQNNTAYRQGTGISVSQSQASGNVAFDNGTGIFGYGATVSGNRVYHNSSYGIDASTYGLFQGNTAYSNGVGIYAEGSTFSGQVLNNLVYGNTNQGLLVHSGYAGALLANNTVYQPVGDAIRLENSSHNVTLRNNILWVQAGYDLFIALDSEVGLDSDYNDLYATATGKLGSWEGQAFSSLASWSYQVGQDAHSLAADPAFVNAAGADGILGFSANPDGSAAQVIDNGGSGFAVSGTWTTATGGFNNSYLQSTTATDVATYTFTGLTPGWFQVAATWPATSGDNQSAYTVLDGGLSAGTVMVNQSQAPADFVAAGASWKTLGLYYLAGTTLTVQLARGYSGYSVAADAVRIQRVQGNGGGDDNFLIQGGSPTIDAGDPATYYLAEPAPNGGRVNLGNTGNTPQAAASPSPLVQVLAPNGLDKLQQGQTVTVQWRSDGLTLTRPVALIDAGGPTQGNWLAEAYRTDSGYHTSFTNAVNTSAVSNPAPQAVYQSYAYTSGGVGSELSYQLPLPDGSYTVRLHFVEPSYGSAGQRLFDVKAQGVLVQANYDIFAAAGAQYKATTLSFTVTAAGGAGLLLELVSRNSAGAILSGIEVTAANANGVASPTANLAVSADGGSTWSNVASNLAMDAYGRGTYAWTVPTTATPGNQYELRVTANTAGQPQGLSQPFLVANNGHSYYVNDNSTAGDVYTTAVGNDLNSGKTPDRPMASLAALLAAYQFGPGDTIYVDTGSYQVVRNIVLGPNASGVRIQGPGTGVAVLNRGNTSSGSYVVQLAGADNVTLDHLSLTGGYEGLYAASGVGSTGLTVSNSSLYGNQDSGAYLLTSNDHATFSNDLFANETYGLNVSSAAVVVSGSTASNCSIGFYVSSDGALLDGDTAYGCSIGVSISSGSAALGIVRNSTVHDNTSSGISASGNVLVQNNTAYRQGTGISVSQSQASGNVAFDNGTGIFGYGATVSGNRVYHNSSYGIDASTYGLFQGNTAYSNGVGIYAEGSTFSGQVLNNLVYGNTNQGLLVHSGYAGALLANNTVYQPVGDAIRLENSSHNVTLRNNILYVLAGYDLYVASDSQTGFNSDYNLFFLGATPDPNAHLGFWNSTTQNLSGGPNFLSNWTAASAQDNHSVYGDPLFVEYKGADNTLGYSTAGNGYDGGPDDNFYLSQHSPAIDSGDYRGTPTTDKAGNPRTDDPGTPNQGPPFYTESNLGSSSFLSSGTAQGWHADDNSWTLTLPFTFTFYGTAYTSVAVSSNGFLQFAGADSASSANNSDANLLNDVRIAPLWDNLRTDQAGDDIFVDTSTPNQVTIRWQAHTVSGNNPTNFAITLFSTGNIRFDYGAGNTGLTPTIGISSGDGITGVLSAYDGQATLTNANSLSYLFTAHSYTDIGAYEFTGNSNATTPPTITGTTPTAVHAGGNTGAVVSQIVVTFSTPVNPIDAAAPGSYDLRSPGLDGVYDNSDDVVYPVTPQYTQGSTQVTLHVNTPLQAGGYRLTVFSTATASIHDLSGLKLDGDGNGTPGGNYVRTFTVGQATQFQVQAPTYVGLNVPFNVTVTALDGSGAVASAYVGTVHFTSSDGQAVLPLNYAFTTSDLGVHTFSVTLKTLNSQTITVKDATTPSVTGSASSTVVNPATHWVVTTQPPGSVVVGTGFGFVVKAEDGSSNTDLSFNGSVTVGFGSNPGSSTLGGTLTVPVSSGVATFSGLTLNNVANGYTLQVTGGGLTSVTTNPLNVTLPLQVSATTLPAATAGTAYNRTLTVSGGATPYATFQINNFQGGTTGLTAAAVSVNAGTGVVTVSGTPTAAGTFAFTLNVTDSANATLTQNYSVTVNGALHLSATTLAGATAGTAYNRTLTVSGGTTPYTTFQISNFQGGTTGLTATAVTVNAGTGVVTVSGTPTAAGTFSFTLNVTDSAGATLTQGYTVTVNGALHVSATTLPAATAGTAYNRTLTVSGGTTPYTTFQISNFQGGTTGLTAAAVTVNAGTGLVTVSGTPTAAGTFSFTLNVTDSAGATLTQGYTVTVNGPLQVSATTLPAATAGTAYNQTLTVSGGTTPYTTFTITNFQGGTTGLTASAVTVNAGTGVVTVSGTPSAAGTFSITVNVTDSAGATLSQSYTVTVNAAFSWHIAAEAVGSDGKTRLLWDRTDGTAVVWSVNTATNQVTAGPTYGPYAGWTATKLATGADGITRLLWNNTNGSASLWLLDAAGNVLSSTGYGPYTGWTVSDLAVGSDNNARLLWTNTNGAAVVWTVNTATSQVTAGPAFGPYSGWTATKLAAGADGKLRLLWNHTSGQAQVWVLDGSGNYLTSVAFGPAAGWTAVDLTVSSDGNTHLLWTNTNGTAVVWNVNTGNGQVSAGPGYGPYAGWTARHLVIVTDGSLRLLWDNTNGQESLWLLDASGNFLGSEGFGPY